MSAIENYQGSLIDIAIFILLAATPSVVALLVAHWPGRKPDRKARFVLYSTIGTYGIIALSVVVALFFYLVADFLAPVWKDLGYERSALASYYLYVISRYLAIGISVASIAAVPILIRGARRPILSDNLE